MKTCVYWVIATACLIWPVTGKEKPSPPKPSPVPAFSPAKQPVVTGEFPVGFIIITFKETAIPGEISQAIATVRSVSGANQEADAGAASKSYGSGITQEEYFKIYSNGITWPKIVVMPNESTCYQDPHFYGYYCEYDYWENPMGWKSREEGDKRVGKMNQDALRFANQSYRGPKPRFTCFNYVTTRPEAPAQEISDALLGFYQDRSADPGRTRMSKARRSKAKYQGMKDFDPWAYYAPRSKWGDPMWPNSKVQIDNFSGGTLAHELGHCLGAPDVYRIGRTNDGISGSASLLAYGPTANAFSRFYHHAFIQERNHPTIKSAGTYTLHPRHITPQDDQAVGYLIPTNHPHYFYHVEYLHRENATVGVGPSHEGMLISVVNLGLDSYLGSPDYFYVYRPNDPFFRGHGDTNDCLFGKSHRRTEFNLTTEPSARLPNLLDSGVAFKNIEEHDGTLSFELVLNRDPVTGSAYNNSMLPQIRLDRVSDVQATSFTMDCTIKFRGEPLKTAYGFCWSTSKNPTIRDATYSLAHRECYRGHAINLDPNTTYYIRAFATNGVGVRYSDEEQSIKTAELKALPSAIGPLFTDSFSNNSYLFEKYSNETTETDDTFIGYSPTCVLAKLISYYRPAKFTAAGLDSDSKPSAIDFDQLSWNPSADDFPMRLEEINRFFGHIYDLSRQLNLHSPKPEKDFVKNLVKLTGVRSRPVLTLLSEDNLKQVSELIRKDLEQSRPVMILLAYNTEGVTNPIRWALFDGINSKGQFHVDFPRNAKFLIDGEWQKARSGGCRPQDLLLPLYQTYIVTSCYYPSSR